jgi:hypothetical protein
MWGQSLKVYTARDTEDKEDVSLQEILNCKRYCTQKVAEEHLEAMLLEGSIIEGC